MSAVFLFLQRFNLYLKFVERPYNRPHAPPFGGVAEVT
jgi:hypothetical protein